jgi:hypothetical protein
MAVRMVSESAGGDRVTFDFSDLQTNPKLAAEDFKLAKPDGFTETTIPAAPAAPPATQGDSDPAAVKLTADRVARLKRTSTVSAWTSGSTSSTKTARRPFSTSPWL